MKRISLLLVALNALLTSVAFAVNDVGSFYAVLKQQRYNQSSTLPPTLSGSQPYRFGSYISRASGGTLTSGTLTPPNTGTVNTPQPYAPNDDGTGSLGYEQRFTTSSAREAAFGDGQYSLHIIGGNGTYDSTLTLSGGIYPGEIPQVSNTNFRNGALVIDRTQPFTVTWNSFADHGANDVVVFSLSDSGGQTLMQQILAPTATSQLIPANTFQTAQEYSIELIFIKVSDVNTGSIPGSTGSAGYGLSTKINISIASSLALDPSFQAPSFRTPDGSKLLLLPDGKFVLYSLIQTLADQPAGPITRYLADGTLDPAFLFSSDYYIVFSSTVTPAGRLIVAAEQIIYGVNGTLGFDVDYDGYHILALNSDGSIDSSFNSAAQATGGEVRAMTVQPDGKILVAGRFTKYGGVTRSGIVRLLANGTVDPGFAPVTLTATNAGIQPPALWVEPAVQSDGKILIAGDFDTVNGVACPGVARLNSDGTRDSSFSATDFSLSLAGNGTTRPIRGLVIQADGKIVLGGRFTVSATFAANHTGQIFTRLPLIRLNSNGSADQNYGYFGDLNRATGFSLMRHMSMQTDGKIVAVGNSVFRFNDTDGSLDSSFQQIDLTIHGNPDAAQIYRIQIQPDARILLGGTFTEITGAAGERFGVARLNSDGSVDSLTTSEQPAQKTAPSSFARQPDGSVLIAFSQTLSIDLAIPHSYGRLLADGSFDGSFDPLASIPTPITAHRFSTLPSGNIFVFGTDSSGIFSYTVITPSGANIGLPNADPNVSFANAYPQPDGKVIVASPDAQSVVNHTQLQRLNADGSVDGSFNLDAQIDQVQRDGSTNITTVASGDAVLSILSSTKILFAYLATDGTHRLVRLNNDGSLDSTFPTASFAASTTSLSPTFVFDPQHPGPRVRVTALSANLPAFADAQELASGKVIVVGDFTSYLGNPVHGIVRLISDGTFDSTFQPAGGAQWTQTTETTTVHPTIDNVELGDNGKLLITGTFEAFNGTVMPGIALLNADGSLDTAFAAPVTRQKFDAWPTYLARQPDGSFLLSGPYSFAGQRESPSFFRILSPLQLTSAISRKAHGGAGTFDINLLNANFGPECRSSGGNHTLVFTFTNNVTSGTAAVTSGIGSVTGSPTFSGNTMTVNLTGVTDVQQITVTLSNVTDSFAQVLPDTAVSVNMLIGDTTGNKTVSASDVAQTKGQSGLPVTAANFRTDVNANGAITASDVAQVKANAGHTLP